jgi:preprotein translocase subunit SecG
MKMKTISECKAFLTLLTISLIVYFLVSSTALIVTESQGKRDYSEKSTNEEPNDSSSGRSEKKGSDAIGIKGDQLIYCEGDLNSCHNVLTNIICSNVKYCIVGDITPFVMSNPL